MSKSTKNTANQLVVSKSATVTALDRLKEELKGLKVITESQYTTKSAIEGFGTAISEETKLENLVRMHSSVTGREKAYNESTAALQKLLGGDFAVPVFKISNYVVSDIVNDIVLRIRVISVKERKDQLETLVAKAQSFMTERDKFALFQQELANAGIDLGDVQQLDAE